MTQGMIRISQTQVVANPPDIAELRDEFSATGCARMPGFLDTRLRDRLLDWIREAQFEVKNEVHEGRVFGTTLFIPRTEPSLFLLHFMLNRPALFEAVEKIAGCERLGNFTGRLHRTSAETAHHIDWHDDAAHTRTVGININLSAHKYSGGLFQLRDAQGTVRSEVGRAEPGDAFLFRIGEGWQHRLAPVETGVRTVGVGWFLTHPGRDEYAEHEFLKRMRRAEGAPDMKAPQLSR
jgi:hypothetical protein